METKIRKKISRGHQSKKKSIRTGLPHKLTPSDTEPTKNQVFPDDLLDEILAKWSG